MNTAKPRPNSNNPEFIKNWLNGNSINYQEVVDRWLENNDNEEAKKEKE